MSSSTRQGSGRCTHYAIAAAARLQVRCRNSAQRLCHVPQAHTLVQVLAHQAVRTGYQNRVHRRCGPAVIRSPRTHSP